MADNGAKRFDVVVLGATGFVGRLVSEEIATNYNKQLRWAIAGRDKVKLEHVRSELVDFNPDCRGVPLLSFDIHDQGSVDSVIGQAKVVIATTGPYAELGTPVVDACVRLGTHYCDLSGEVPWQRRMADRYHEQAAARGVRLVTACGMESVPPDLGAFVIAKYMREKLGRKCASVAMTVQSSSGFLQSSSGGMSGGSWWSYMGVFEREKLRELVAMQSPYYLYPKGLSRGPDTPDIYTPGYVRELRQYTIPFLLQMGDRKVVHRSNALLGQSYGENFRFQEGIAAPGPLSALVGSLLTLVVVTMLVIPIFHILLRLVVHKPGQGPSFDVQLKGTWKTLFVGRTEEDPGVEPRTVHAIIGDGARDPGYWGTARMLLECALCMALQEDDLKRERTVPGGFLTPAAALGTVLVDRLRQSGIAVVVRERHGIAKKPWAPISRLFRLSKSRVIAASEDPETVSLTALPPGLAEGTDTHLPSDSLQCAYGGSFSSMAESLEDIEQANQQSPQPSHRLSEAAQHVPHTAASPAVTEVSMAASSPAPVAAAPHAVSISLLTSCPAHSDPLLNAPPAVPSPQIAADSLSSLKPAAPPTGSTMRQCPTNPLFDDNDGEKDDGVESPTKPSLIQKMEAAHQAMLRQQLEHFRQELAAVEANWTARHEDTIETLQAQHAAELAALEATYAQQVAELKAKLRAVSGELQRLRRLQQEERTLVEPQLPAQLRPLDRQLQQGGYMRLASRDEEGSRPRLPAERRRRLTLGTGGPAVLPAPAAAALPRLRPGQQLLQSQDGAMLPASRQQEGPTAVARPTSGHASGAVSQRQGNKAAQLQSQLWVVASQLSRPQEIEEDSGGEGRAQHAQRSSKARLLREAAKAQAAAEWAAEQDEEGVQQEQRAPFARANKRGANQAADLSERLRAALWQSQGGEVRQRRHHQPQSYHQQQREKQVTAREETADEAVVLVAVANAEQATGNQPPQLASKPTVQQQCAKGSAAAATTQEAVQRARLPSLGRKPSKDRLGGPFAVNRSPLLARNV
ncbi:hypothetical protein N2152v2_008926 [Parachlorella kessleri]